MNTEVVIVIFVISIGLLFLDKLKTGFLWLASFFSLANAPYEGRFELVDQLINPIRSREAIQEMRSRADNGWATVVRLLSGESVNLGEIGGDKLLTWLRANGRYWEVTQVTPNGDFVRLVWEIDCVPISDDPPTIQSEAAMM